ncbi:sporulation protein YunB [Rummeliibacillus stabekisii]|nr:sporulation protein YunB [Rummeliibacillus stabekisii]
MKKRKKLFVVKRSRFLPVVLGSIVGCVLLFFYLINVRLMPIFLQYAEAETNSIASYVISQAIYADKDGEQNNYDIIEKVDPGSNGDSSMTDTKLDTAAINRIISEKYKLVQSYLEEAESGNLDHLPKADNIEYDVDAMQKDGGIIFYVPLGLATGMPMLGNLGPKIPIRFHIVGHVNVDVERNIKEFGINNAYVELSVKTKVNVQIIVPFASKSAIVEQTNPVAATLIKGGVPNVYSKDGSTSPSVEVPLPTEGNKNKEQNENAH